MQNAPIITRFEQGEIAPDAILAEELACPGSDMRCGVNLIAQPPAELQEQIGAIQQHLQRAQPDQYYYPAGNLHLTLLEICSSRSPAEANQIAMSVIRQVESILQGIEPFSLNSPTLVCDARACALNFEGQTLFLQDVRAQLIEKVRGLGIYYQPRYFPKTAHITLMRYIRALNQDLNEWQQHLKSTPIHPGLVWKIDALSITWGPTWYGMQKRIHTMGKYAFA